MQLAQIAPALLDRGLLPDAALRFGIRRLLAERLAAEWARAAADPAARTAEWVSRLSAAPVALHPEAANRQHYEVPAEFFRLVLGPHLKYSCGLWPEGVTTLAQAEAAMLAATTQRARLADGQTILDLGCGWGALSLYLAERFPGCRIVAVSNSKSQGKHIAAEAVRRGLLNVRHQVADVNRFGLPETGERFDRVVSVEMFEHVRNYAVLFERIATWLRPGGHLFVHVFCHRDLTYAFEDEGPGDWMARHFFTGGLMPSADLLPAFAGPLALAERWPVPGTHYQKTAEAWLRQLDAHREPVRASFESAYGAGQGRRWLERWRVFFIACAELFGTAGGDEWGVEHYLFSA